MTIIWDQIKESFSADGSLRDLYFFASNIENWKLFLEAVPKSGFSYSFRKNGNPCGFPLNIKSIFYEKENSSLMLTLEKEGVGFNCHFFTEEEIELDISPKEVNGQNSLNIVLDFMSYFSKSIGLPCVLTYENMPEHAIIECSNEIGSVPILVHNKVPQLARDLT